MAKEELAWPCACCGYLTITEPGHASYEICPICFWEDDPAQFGDPLAKRGANLVSLQEARFNFATFGSSDPLYIESVRPPTADDQRDPEWKCPPS